MRILLAANPEADQPWVTDAAADLVRQTGGSVAVVAVDALPDAARGAGGFGSTGA